jgi:protease IV
MSRSLPVLALALAVTGCGRFYLVTHDHVIMDGPVVTQSRILQESQPVGLAGPVQENAIGNGSCAGTGPKVAIVDVDGLLLNTDLTGSYSLGENPVALFRERLDAIAGDPCVRAVVLRINSPGGGVAASDTMWRDLQAFRARTHLPVVACLLDLGTGGAYYLATATDLILAQPTTITGGIGVIFNVYNLADVMSGGQVSSVAQPIKAGQYIDVGSPVYGAYESDGQPNEKLPHAKEILQALADEFHTRFRRVVQQARAGIDPKSPVFDGRIFTAQKALEYGLIDGLGYLDDAIAAAKERAGIPEARLVLYHRSNDPAHSPYAVTPNVPLQSTLLPYSVPGPDRSRLPTFLYMWQPEPTMERLGGK